MQCGGSGMFIPDPGSDFFPSRIRSGSIPDPGSSSKEFKYFYRIRMVKLDFNTVHNSKQPHLFRVLACPSLNIQKENKGVGTKKALSKPPVTCEQCGVTVVNKHVLKRHVSNQVLCWNLAYTNPAEPLTQLVLESHPF